MSARRFVILGSTPGNGKTTLGRELARRLEVPFIELDSWVHSPDWTELATEELLDRLAPVLADPGWVIDGTFEHKLGTRLLGHPDVVVWMDLPAHVWFARLVSRTFRRVAFRERLWNGNRETWRDAIGGRDAIIPFAVRACIRRRREWPLALAPFPTLRLRSRREVAHFLERFAPAGQGGSQ